MTKIKLYIATSIDGYIARKNGSIDWLEKIPSPDNNDYGYADFMKQIDTIVMGRRTYEDVLGFDVPWPYAEYKSIVITRSENYKTKTPNTSIINNLEYDVIQNLLQNSRKNIWIVGGGEIISHLLNLDVIDEIFLFIMPLVLGSGLPLFPDKPKETWFKQVESKSWETGVVMIKYQRT